MKFHVLIGVFLIACSLFTGTSFGQAKRKTSSKEKNYSSTQLTFGNNSYISKYIKLDKANVKVKRNNHCEYCCSLKGNLDIKLATPKSKKYFVIVFTNWRGNEQKYSQNPISFLRNRNGDSTSGDPTGYTEVNWKEHPRSRALIVKKITESYFKKDAAKYTALMKWLQNTINPNAYETNLFLPGPHTLAHLGVLDENSILRFNLSDLSIPARINFFLEEDNGAPKSTISHEHNTFADNTGFTYKFILFSLTDNEVYESDEISASYSIPKSEVIVEK